MDNNKYRSYTQQMDKALKAFEYTTEWADLVNALGKVNKVLANNQQFPVIPRRFMVGQRLAQCMHPGLPNGVQLKALETYDLLFKAIGTDRLMQELSIYSNGLFPLLSHADLNVKPALLDLYELHFLPLNERLRPALDGFLIATLHGLEENTEFYKRTDDLLLRVCSGVGSEYFYGSLWRCISNDPSVRLHGMNFLIAHFNKKRPLENQMHILGTSIETLINAICVSLLDTRNVLVQRAALDLLLCCFPLHNQQIKQNDMITIATAAVTVLLRRDTSLSRRLHAWLFNMDSVASKKSTNLPIYGAGSSSSNQYNSQLSTGTSREQREKERKILYFETYAKQLVIEAYKNCLSNPSSMIDIPNSWSSLGDFWCYRLLICLIDHNEICALILDELSIEILRAMCLDFYSQTAPKPELIRTMRLLLNSMDISYLWKRISNLLNKVCKEKKSLGPNASAGSKNIDSNSIEKSAIQPVGAGSTNILELCSVSDFIMDSLPVQNYHEAAKLYLPWTLNNILKLMNEQCDTFEVHEFFSLLRVVRRIFQNIQLQLNEDLYIRDPDYRYTSNASMVHHNMSLANDKIVREDDEYAEEALEQSSAESSNNSHANNTTSANDTSNSNQGEVVEEESPTIISPSLSNLVESYQNFFHTLVTRRLVCVSQETTENINLGSKINELYMVCSNSLLRKLPVTGQELKMPIILVEKNLSSVYERMCELLLDISTMPLAMDQLGEGDPEADMGTNYKQDKVGSELGSDDNPDRPTSSRSDGTHVQGFNLDYCKPWVKDLIILSGFVEEAVTINYSSIRVLLNLLSVSKLALEPSFAAANMIGQVSIPSFAAEISAVVGDSLLYDQRLESRSVAFKQMLTEDEYAYISDKTCWFQMVMKKLWGYLRCGPKWELYLDTVNLIQHLHNLTYQTSICEDVICCNMNSLDESIAYEARKIFEDLMFSLPRDTKSVSLLKHRELERPLFFMLDSLSHKMDPFNCSAGHWLSRVFKSNLIARVLEPTLLILLHVDTARLPSSNTKVTLTNQLHSHLLFYAQVYDSHRIVYALNTLWNIISAEPHRGLFSMAKSTIGVSYDLQLLYGRHRNSIAGKDFNAEIVIEGLSQFRNISLLEVVITICLDYLCGYYLNLSQAKLTQAEILGNQRVRILACEILRGILSNFIEAIKSRPTFLPLIHDMLNRCKVQKIILHCIITSVYCAHQQMLDCSSTSTEMNRSDNKNFDNDEVTSSELIDFNDGININSSMNASIFRENFQKTLLRLLEDVLKLEYRVAPANVITETECPAGRRESDSRSARVRYQPDITSSSLKYYQNILISSQSMFLTAVQTALQQIHQADLHVNWLSMIESTLPIAGRSLTRLTVCVITQLCHNLEMISQMIIEGKDTQETKLAMTPNYLSILIKSLSALAHYCLVDSSVGAHGQQALSPGTNLTQRSESLSTLASTATVGQSINAASLSQGCVSSASSVTLTSAGTNGPSSLGPLHAISNLWHVFSQDQGQDSLSSYSMAQGSNQSDPIVSARKTILSRLSRIISALLRVWKAMVAIENHPSNEHSLPWRVLGSPADVKKQILNFLSPISVIHGTHFMSAISVVWYDLRTIVTIKSNALVKRVVIPTCSADQSLLVQIVAAIRVLPMESVLQTTRQVMRSPPQAQDTRNKRRVPLEVGLLQFFLAYIKEYPVSQLLECWKSLLQLLREGVQLGPPAMPLAQFHLLAILHEFVQTAPLIEDRKDQKDLQDVTQKLIESFTNVVGARLAQTRWLRSGLEVEPGPQNDALDEEGTMDLFERNFATNEQDGSIFSGESKLSEHFTDADSIISTTTINASSNAEGDDSSYLAKFSVQALSALAEFVAPVLDVVYVSDEKEKVVSLINSIMYYVTPYLRNHHQHNSPSFLACSHLLSSISGYQYTRKAWRKDALELLLDSQFFQMDSSCMEHWKVIVDHLMTHDKTTFRDFLSRMSINQSGGALKLFASRDQEFEQRAQLIKRMAFILFCSERDQYQKYIPEIQEKLIESLRVSQSDLVQAQIMLCFRVLVIRSSAHHLTSLWPFVYTEMFQVLLEIESQLESESEGENMKKQEPNGSSHRCQLFLYTCKLLDIVLALPADSLPQFQMYRWSFINGCDDPDDTQSSSAPFEPHLVRIERRLRAKNPNPTLLPWRTHFPILTLSKISDPMELHPFFYTLVKMNEREESCTSSNSGGCQAKNTGTPGGDSLQLEFIDSIIESDFLEPYIQ